MSHVGMFDQDNQADKDHQGDLVIDPVDPADTEAPSTGAPEQQVAAQHQADADDAEYVNIRPAWYRVGKGLILVGIFCWFGLFVAGKVRTWFDEQLDPPGEPETAVAVIIPSGATTANIGKLLQSQEIVPNSTFFRYFAEWKDEGNFQAGEYEFFTNSSAEEAIAVLNIGPEPLVFQRFTIREGLWIEEILPDIASQLEDVTLAQLRAVLADGSVNPRYRPEGNQSWEGLLFPDTYEISEDADALEVLLKMSDEFAKVTGDLSYGSNVSPLDLSSYEILIVASLIEAETKVAEERPIVASVIYNRLREGWALGIDATCIYSTGDRRVVLTREILDAGGPYGCRGVIGLPPTPINAPGKASLDAAINPDETEYMYYVLTNPNGSHSFAETDQEFAEYKQICGDLGLC